LASTPRARTCLVTGATSGIGLATVKGLADAGAHVILVARTEAKARRALDQLASASRSDRLEVAVADLSVQHDIRRLADDIARQHSRLDVLVNNAGLISQQRRVTSDGIELTWAVNYLAPFLLTNLLLDLLVQSAPARIVTVASRSQGRGTIDFSDLQFERRPYRMLAAYAQSKLATVLFTVELARRLGGAGVTANCLHPGFVASDLGRKPDGRLTLQWRLVRRFAVSADRGALTSLYLCLSPEVTGNTGQYFVGTRPAEPNPASRDPHLKARLWEVSAAMTGLPRESA
jgi:NAD(P)-dependent dehydrogenase (short-subunit alcohol dehydrogenase family)